MQHNYIGTHFYNNDQQQYTKHYEYQPQLISLNPMTGHVNEHLMVHVHTEGFENCLYDNTVWIAQVKDKDSQQILQTTRLNNRQLAEGITAFQLGKFTESKTLSISFINSTEPHNVYNTNNLSFGVLPTPQTRPMQKQAFQLDEDFEFDEEDEFMEVNFPLPSRRRQVAQQHALTKLNFEFDASYFEHTVESHMSDLMHSAHNLMQMTPPPPPVVHKKPNKYALLLGIAEYTSMDALKTPEFDGMLLESRLLDQDYKVERLNNGAVNAYTISQQLARIAADIGQPGPEDQLVVHFSGHGLPGRLCFGHYHPKDESSFITLPQLLSLIPPRISNVLIVLDCCHSGTTLLQTPPPQILSSQQIHIVSSTMSDVALEDNYHGLFTASLCRALRTARAQSVPFSSLFNEIADELREHQQMPHLYQISGMKPFIFGAMNER